MVLALLVISWDKGLDYKGLDYKGLHNKGPLFTSEQVFLCLQETIRPWAVQAGKKSIRGPVVPDPLKTSL